uniref:Large ribosomal subunit protein uL4c n=1 Tax=Melanthalia intermedia TaxID=172989 RepID=A0A345UAU9_9FLOR|nr:ribosomal protein L4 [Melanthalia intermedia]AXI97585.1 ribosomal protein L4 [Melanthalia intermedia]
MNVKKKLLYPVKLNRNKVTKSDKEIELRPTNCDNKSMHIVYRALAQQLHNKRQSSAHTKTRSEIRGGGRKPWKQKGTGRARAGSIRSPLWRGGGVVFGPSTKNTKKINKKEKRLALKILIKNKLKKITAIEKIMIDSHHPSTKLVIDTIKGYNLDIRNKENTLIIVEKKTHSLYLSVRNLSNVELIAINNINVISLLKAKQIIITTNALKILNQKYDG